MIMRCDKMPLVIGTVISVIVLCGCSNIKKPQSKLMVLPNPSEEFSPKRALSFPAGTSRWLFCTATNPRLIGKEYEISDGTRYQVTIFTLSSVEKEQIDKNFEVIRQRENLFLDSDTSNGWRLIGYRKDFLSNEGKSSYFINAIKGDISIAITVTLNRDREIEKPHLQLIADILNGKLRKRDVDKNST
jgi:hypothetical protein